MDIKELRYNFVFCFAQEDFWKYILGKELYENSNVRIYNETFEGPWILKKLFHCHWAYSINRRINLPFKPLWYKRMYKQNFNNDLPICFVYIGGIPADKDKNSFMNYVREQDPRNRQVLLYEDVVTKDHNEDEQLRNYWKKYDLIVTYSKEDAEYFGIHFFEEKICSKWEEFDNSKLVYDVYFLGAAKDRLNKIYSIYDYLEKNGAVCNFLIAGVSKKDRIERKGIKYIKNITYRENIANVSKTKCILEITQQGVSNTTLRAREAVTYGRRLITDCKRCNSEYFNEGQLQIIENIEDIDVNLAKSAFSINDYPSKINANPIDRLHDIQNELDKESNNA